VPRIESAADVDSWLELMVSSALAGGARFSSAPFRLPHRLELPGQRRELRVGAGGGPLGYATPGFREPQAQLK